MKKIMKRVLSWTLAVAVALPMGTTMAWEGPLNGAGSVNEFETEVNAVLDTLTLKHRASLMQGGIQGEWGQSNWYHHQTKAIPFKNVNPLNMANGPMGVNGSPAGSSDTSGKQTSFGSGLIMAATWNTDLMYNVGTVLGEESLAKNVHLFEAPAININRDLLGGRTFEYLTEDPFLNGSMVVPYIQGVQDNNVAANIKHFMANNQETNRNNVSAHATERAMHEIYLPGFEAAVEKADAWSLMTAANRINGTYTSDNRYLLTNLLRYSWGFRGMALTDWCRTRSTTIAAKAGLDLSMPGSPTSLYAYDRIVSEVQNGNLDEKVVTQAAQNVLRVLHLTGAMGNVPRAAGSINTAQHQNVAKQVAEEGIVLLKNDAPVGSANKALPLKKSELSSVAVVGAHHSSIFYKPGAGGSGATTPPYQITYLQGLQNSLAGTGVNVNSVNYSETDFEATKAASVAAAGASDVAVVVVGMKNAYPANDPVTGPYDDTEGYDRPDLHFPAKQLELINAVAAVNPKTIVVITGSALEVEGFIDNVPAALQAFYPGMEAGNALAEILFGDVNPSGKMPHTLPKRYEDTCAYTTVSKNTDVEYSEGVFVGYRWNDYKNIEPRYAFGYGLSYTDFEYSNITLDKTSMGPEDKLTVSVDVTNTGDYDGKEVVQLYVHDNEASVERPLKELKAFNKIFLAVGETKTVTFELDKTALSFWNVETHSWLAEAGGFEVWIGSASDDIRQTAGFTLSESSAPDPNFKVIQAENAATKANAVVESSIENYSGSGYLNLTGKTSKATFNVNADAAGKYSIIVKYSNAATSNADANITVNGVLKGNVYGQSTHFASSWNYDSVDVLLNEGANTVEVAAKTIGFNLDSLIVQKIDRAETSLPEQIPDEVDPTPPGSEIEEIDGNIYEAETATLSDCIVATNHTGFKGTGFVDFGGQNSNIQWSVNVPDDDEYTVEFRFASTGTRPCDLYIDGTMVKTYTMPGSTATDPWIVWNNEGYKFTLTKGIHTIKLVSTTVSGPNVDRLVIKRDGSVYEAEKATLGGGTIVASDRAGFSGTGFADYGNAGSFVEFNITIPTFSPYVIEARYAAQTDRPCDIYIDGEKVGTYSFINTIPGTIPDAALTNWTLEKKGFSLNAGSHTVKLVTVGAGPNLDRIVVRGGMVTSDITAPTVSASTPANNDVDVSFEDNITVTFSELIKFGSGAEGITLKKGSTDVAFTKTIMGNKLIIDPANILDSLGAYTLTLPVGAVADAVNNELVAEYVLNFTTAKKVLIGDYDIVSNINLAGAGSLANAQSKLSDFWNAGTYYTLSGQSAMTWTATGGIKFAWSTFAQINAKNSLKTFKLTANLKAVSNAQWLGIGVRSSLTNFKIPDSASGNIMGKATQGLIFMLKSTSSDTTNLWVGVRKASDETTSNVFTIPVSVGYITSDFKNVVVEDAGTFISILVGGNLVAKVVLNENSIVNGSYTAGEVFDGAGTSKGTFTDANLPVEGGRLGIYQRANNAEIRSLKVEKKLSFDGLVAKIAEAKTYTSEGYTTISFGNLAQTIADAESLLLNTEVTLREVDGSISALDNAIGMLTHVSYTIPQMNIGTTYYENFNSVLSDTKITSDWTIPYMANAYMFSGSGYAKVTWSGSGTAGNGSVLATAQSYTNYKFETNLSSTQGGLHSVIALRNPAETKTMAVTDGTYDYNTLGELREGDTYVVNGVNNYERPGTEGIMVILSGAGIATDEFALLFKDGLPAKVRIPGTTAYLTNQQKAEYILKYPLGVNITQNTKITIYDLDDKVYIFMDGKPAARIELSSLTSNIYSAGTVYNSQNQVVGTPFSGMVVARGGHIAYGVRTNNIDINDISIEGELVPETYIQGVDFVGSDVKVTLNSNTIVEGKKLVLALYSSDNKMIYVQTLDAMIGEGETESIFNLVPAGWYKVKVMLFDGMTTLKPLSDTYVISN